MLKNLEINLESTNKILLELGPNCPLLKHLKIRWLKDTLATHI